jgi:hypothetical protein
LRGERNVSVDDFFGAQIKGLFFAQIKGLFKQTINDEIRRAVKNCIFDRIHLHRAAGWRQDGCSGLFILWYYSETGALLVA